ncbi:MAG: FHA domain-containing protein [Deltaproteobacteria bacterium]|nr:FHA domain-containing protein [Deltaproteobacteria bacterium]
MKCPSCGIEILNPGKFCGSCGARLVQNLCPNGHVLRDVDEVCPHCATQRQPKIKTITPENKGKTLFEINTVVPLSRSQDEMKEFAPENKAYISSLEGRRTKIVKTESAFTGVVLVGWLVSFDRRLEGEDFKIFSTENIIGASPTCNIVIDQETVSSRHAVISYRDGHFYIRDLGSTNGTLLNGIRLDREMMLHDGDNITFGAFNTIFVSIKRK